MPSSHVPRFIAAKRDVAVPMSDQHNATEGQKMARIPVRAKLVEKFTENPGKILHVESLARELSLEIRQVRTGMANMMSDNVLPGLQRVVSGHSWVYKPESNAETPRGDDRTQTPANAPRRRRGKMRSFQEVGETRDGDIIIKDEKGDLFRAQPL